MLFFTLVGLELELDVIGQTWGIMLILVAVRIVGIMIGSYIGTVAVQDRSSGNAILGLGFITQAGVSVGLAKEIGVEFSEWGPELASLSIGVIVLNQVLGPPVLKWAINRVGEAHTKHESPEFDGVRDALIFGVDSQSLAVARQLQEHNWNVVLVTREPEVIANKTEDSPHIELLSEINLDTLRKLQMNGADGVVLMHSDDENFAICELIFEHFGIDNVIVQLDEREHFEKFHELGALVVQPETAMVSLLDQFVRSPHAASLLLGMDPNEEFMEIEMTNSKLNGIAIRDIHLPHDVLILYITRRGNRLDSHGATRFKVGDHITVVGSPDSLNEVEIKFTSS